MISVCFSYDWRLSANRRFWILQTVLRTDIRPSHRIIFLSPPLIHRIITVGAHLNKKLALSWLFWFSFTWVICKIKIFIYHCNQCYFYSVSLHNYQVLFYLLFDYEVISIFTSKMKYVWDYLSSFFFFLRLKIIG